MSKSRLKEIHEGIDSTYDKHIDMCQRSQVKVKNELYQFNRHMIKSLYKQNIDDQVTSYDAHINEVAHMSGGLYREYMRKHLDPGEYYSSKHVHTYLELYADIMLFFTFVTPHLHHVLGWPPISANFLKLSPQLFPKDVQNVVFW